MEPAQRNKLPKRQLDSTILHFVSPNPFVHPAPRTLAPSLSRSLPSTAHSASRLPAPNPTARSHSLSSCPRWLYSSPSLVLMSFPRWCFRTMYVPTRRGRFAVLSNPGFIHALLTPLP